MGEKWNVDLRFDTNDPASAEEVREQFAAHPFNEVFGVEDLAPTELESRVMGDVAAATQDVLAAYGMPPMDIPEERVHIITEEEFAEKVQGGEVRGKMSYGHIYVLRTDDRMRFVHDITHETAHATSYYQLAVRHRKSEEGKAVSRIGLRRGGLHVVKRMGEDNISFFGIDEAATELFARRIRERFLERSGDLDATERESLLSATVYLPQVRVLDACLDLAAEHYGSRAAAERALFRDYLEGTYDFLRTLERKQKGIVRVLFNMGTEPEDAIAAARALGWDDLVAELAASDEHQT